MTVAGKRGPYAITESHNFGAGERRGMLRLPPPQRAEITRELWQHLRTYLISRNAVSDEGRRTTIIGAEIGDVLTWTESGNTFIAHCGGSAHHHAGSKSPTWLEVNLDDPTALAALELQLLLEDGPQLLVVGSIVEQLADPRPLLRVLRRLLKRHPKNRLIIATFDRACMEEAWPLECWRRLWTAQEIIDFLTASGFDLLSSVSLGIDNIVVASEVSCTPKQYDDFLERNGLPPKSSRLVLMSAIEKIETVNAANIEMWLVESRHLVSQSPIVLSLGGASAAASSNDWLRVWDFASWEERVLAPEAALEAVLHIIYLYDELDQIVYQDYGGYFFHVSQAKRAGLLPPDIVCVVVCHGSNFYLERMGREFQPPDCNRAHVWEKITIELADCVIFPSEYMRSLILDQLKLEPLGATQVHRLPYTYSPEAAAAAPADIDTIAFIGDRCRTNGWNEFSAAVSSLLAGPEAGNIRRIVVLGTTGDGAAITLPRDVILEEIKVHAEALRDTLLALAKQSLVVVPWSGCGQAYPLLQAVDAGCYVLPMRAGGLDELVPKPWRNELFCAPNATSLGTYLRQGLALSRQDRVALIASLRAAMRYEQEGINASWESLRPRPLPLPLMDEINTAESPVTIVVPVYNRPYEEIADLIIGLNSQTLKPREVIFVDDASQHDFAVQHAAQIRSTLEVPARFLRHTCNKGLSAARNTGLLACKTEFIAVHDSDNIAANNFLYRGCLTLQANPRIDAVTFWAARFVDGDDWTTYDPARNPYCPVGDGAVYSLSHYNVFGDAMAVYRVSALRELGGWDESDRAMWEDWALFLSMVAAGRRVMNAPRHEVLYRERHDSMLRTGSEYAARQRFAYCMHTLAPFDAFALQRIIVGQRSISRPPAARELMLSLAHYCLSRARRYVADKPRLRRHARLARSSLRRWVASCRRR